MVENDVIFEMAKLFGKMGIEDVIPSGSSVDKDQLLETAMINLKNLNARYEKPDALTQVQWLMDTYNIQIDELIERIGS